MRGEIGKRILVVDTFTISDTESHLASVSNSKALKKLPGRKIMRVTPGIQSFQDW
jgi:hypothetical protein